MTDKRYELVYTGKLHPGMDAETVKSNLVLSVGISEEKACRLVEAKPKLLKHCATAVEAQVMAEKLERAGICCVVRDRDPHSTSNSKTGNESILMSLLKRQALTAGEEDIVLSSRLLNNRQRSKTA